jgi:ADP-ribose pyrophosphatase YjhB (NUDIX family)
MSDILFRKDGFLFSYRAAGILIQNGKVLLQKPESDDGYAFPGGHVQLGETNADALIREFREELGVDVEVGSLKLVEENFWDWNGERCQQISLSYLVQLKPPFSIPLVGSFHNKEKGDIYLYWVPLDEVKNLKVYPECAAELLAQIDGGTKHVVYREV